jgi:hypothetical protein
MSIASEMLKTGFDAFLETHGEMFVCDGRQINWHAHYYPERNLTGRIVLYDN